MQFSKVPRYIRKFIQFGPHKSFSIFQNRIQDSWNDAYWHYLASQKKASYSWSEIARYHKIDNNFSVFLAQLQNRNFSFLKNIPLADNLIEKADSYEQKKFDLLGSGETSFESIAWHTDFRLQKQSQTADYTYDSTAYYKDIVVMPGQSEKLAKDIKIPWELSRFQHIWVLAHAYKQTGDQKYAQAFYQQTASWLDENHYLLGPNWKCPMDVGIRALNWIVGFSFFSDAPMDESFWQRFVCSLYDHMIYLEHNWEIYDHRTSNHYLSDLIGYFYLCYFFSDLAGVQQKAEWCYQELLHEFDKQIFEEGADYESSTNYHQLVTEIFYHFYILAPALGFVLPDIFIQKFKRMFDFIDWCTPVNGALIQIGDNDSGKIVSGISLDLVTAMKNETSGNVKHFAQFGISVYKTFNWHVSLRHHAYNQRQPSGHFHNDAASVTFAIAGVPIFVDPGSYVYTPSKVWRNRFRSAENHNTFYLEGIEPVLLDDFLFKLDMQEAQTSATHEVDQQTMILQMFHDHYAKFGLRAHRTVACNEADNLLTITDSWEPITKNNKTSNLVSCWNFTLAPEIDAQKTDVGWLLMHNQKPLLEFSSQLAFECADGWYSPSYGIKAPCKQLKARVPLHLNETVITLSSVN